MTPELTAVTFMAVFEDLRDTVIEVLEGLGDVESVDEFRIEVPDRSDVLSLQVVLDITSTWSSPDSQHVGAWTITRVMSILYKPGEGAYYNELWTPAFSLTNSGTNYLCAAEFMTQLADARKSMADWEDECGKGPQSANR